MKEDILSEKPVAQKLLIKENYKVLFVNEPENYKSILGELPPNVTIVAARAAPIDLIQFFVSSKKELEEKLNNLKSLLTPKGLLWVTYPKGTFNIKTGISRDSIRQFAQTIGLEGVAIISVDETWSALRLKIV